MSERYGTPDDENPEWTEEMLRNAKPGSDVFSPDLLAAHAAERRRRGRQKAPTKRMVSLRVAPEVLAAYRSQGKGWQGLMHDTLAAHAPRQSHGKVVRRVGRSESEDLVAGEGANPSQALSIGRYRALAEHVPVLTPREQRAIHAQRIVEPPAVPSIIQAGMYLSDRVVNHAIALVGE